jgi:PAS domain S-box-containing protein
MLITEDLPKNDGFVVGAGNLIGNREDPLWMMVDSIVDYAVFMLDVQGCVLTWNAGAERIEGYRAEEIIGKHFSVFYTVDAVSQGLPSHELTVAASEGRYEDEGWRVKKGGSMFWASVVITALREDDGTLIGFGKVTRDRSEKRIAEQKLREAYENTAKVAAELTEANAYLGNILNASAATAIIAASPKGVIRTFNRGAELMLGYTAEEVVGKHTPELFHLHEEVEDRGRMLSKHFKRPIQGFDVFINSIDMPGGKKTVWKYVHKDGHLIDVNLDISVVHSEDGQPQYYLGIAVDVTEEQRLARKLASTYDQLNSVLEYTSDSVMTISHEWILLYGNRQARESLPNFTVGENYWTCFPGVISTPAEPWLQTAMEERSPVSYEYFYVPHQQWFKVRVFPTEAGLSIFFTDITEEKRLHDQLALEQDLREKRIEALSHMAGGLAHEISNPLAIIHGRASDLQILATDDSPLPAPEVRSACDAIIRTADRAIRILRGLRGFGREASKDPMESASIYEVVDQCVELQQTRFTRHEIQLQVTLEPGIPYFLCRETQIGQVLTNLLNNAFDAIVQSDPAERWVLLTATCSEGRICVSVSDSGPGIPEQFKIHLMEAFFTTKNVGLGMGIGLSLSRAIAQDHDGSLTLCQGAGHTCFRLSLPIRVWGEEVHSQTKK